MVSQKMGLRAAFYMALCLAGGVLSQPGDTAAAIKPSFHADDAVVSSGDTLEKLHADLDGLLDPGNLDKLALANHPGDLNAEIRLRDVLDETHERRVRRSGSGSGSGSSTGPAPRPSSRGTDTTPCDANGAFDADAGTATYARLELAIRTGFYPLRALLPRARPARVHVPNRHPRAHPCPIHDIAGRCSPQGAGEFPSASRTWSAATASTNPAAWPSG